MTSVRVRAGGGRDDYPVDVRQGALDEIAGLLDEVAPAVRRWVVISDSNVAPLHGGRVAARLAEAGLGGDLEVFPAGEENKRRELWSELTDRMLASGVGRDGGVVAVGGGVTGDLAGFVAATFMRGIPVAQIPTSLVAMIDASVGGKTGVDTDHGKNLVGAFHPPVRVVADPSTIATLPRAERAQGLAEAFKHGLILDAAYADRVVDLAAELLDGEADAVQEVVERSIELKAGVVSEDEREAGLREVLNFGHTFGHALEVDRGYRIPHGDAVAVGMLVEAGLGERWGITETGTTDRIRAGLRALELPHELPDFDPERIASLMARDKKARSDTPRIVLLEGPGRVASSDAGWSHPRTVEEIADALGALTR